MVPTYLRADIIAANKPFMEAFGRSDAAEMATLYAGVVVGRPAGLTAGQPGGALTSLGFDSSMGERPLHRESYAQRPRRSTRPLDRFGRTPYRTPRATAGTGARLLGTASYDDAAPSVNPGGLANAALTISNQASSLV